MGEDYDLADFMHIPNLAERDRALRDAAVAHIIADPSGFVRGSWLKFQRIWRPWPIDALYKNSPVAFFMRRLFFQH